MKKRITFLLFCFTILASAILAVYLTSANLRPQNHAEAMTNKGSSSSDNNSDSSQPFNLEDIPVYPDAQSRWIPYPNLGVTSEMTRYKSNASVEDIANFYKTALAQLGWELRREIRTPPSEASLGFYWSDPQGEAPYNLELTVTITGDDLRTVDLYLDRLLDPNRIPLYPGAMQPKVEYVVRQKEDHSEWDKVSRVTTYQVNATPTEIKQFYISFLESYGWKLDESSGDSRSANDGDNGKNDSKNNDDGEALGDSNKQTYTFWWAMEVGFPTEGGGFVDGARLGQVAITLIGDASGQTQVELLARGYNIQDSPQHEQK